MTILDRGTEIKIKGRTYTICFTNKALLQVERESLEGSLPAMMVNVGKAISYSNVFTLFKYGMLAGNPGLVAANELPDDKIEELFYDAVDEYGDYVHVGERCYDALMKCGLIKSQKNIRAAAKTDA